MLSSDGVGWLYSVNSAGAGTHISGQNLTNKLDSLHLHQGDLILLGSLPYPDPGPMAETWRWIARLCESSNVAVHLYGAYDATAAERMFTIPVYHWSAPYDDPLSLADASFFHEGRFLGVSTNGFETMLNDIRRLRPKKVFILGSLYDVYRQFPPTPTPYEHQRDRLNAALQEGGTVPIELDVVKGPLL